MKRFIFSIFIFILFGLFYGYSLIWAEEKVVKIGAVDPLTGPAAKFGEKASILLHKVTKNINSVGGIDIKGEKYLIDLKEYDDESKNDKARAAAERLAAVDKVSIIAATWRSPGAIAVEPVAKKYKIATFTGGFTPKVNYAGAWVFRANPSTLMDYFLPIKWIYENTSMRKIGILAEEGDWGDDTINFLQWWTKTYGGEIKVIGRFPFAAKDFHALITAVKAAKRKGEIDVLFVQSWASAMELFIKQAHATGLSKEIPLYAGTGGFDYISIKDVTPQIEGWHAVSLYGLMLYSSDPEIRKLYSPESIGIFEKYKAMELPLIPLAMSCYTQLMASIEAIKKAGSTNSEIIRNSLASLKMDTLAGLMEWTDYGQPDLTMKMVKWEIVSGNAVPKVIKVEKVPALIELPPKTFPEIKIHK
jgi:ABC-type branched-subunit amino acid transport system substrate-binding protein